MGALQALVTVVGLIGVLALLLLLLCRYLGGWTWSRAWLSSSREEKMVLTRGTTGQYHPNGFMIPSDSDLNLSGGGSFRRFDKTDHDYQLLRQGSTVSIPSGHQGQAAQSQIPPQPLRPAPSLPNYIGQQQYQQQQQQHHPQLQHQSRLEQQSSADSVFTDTPPPSATAISMPPPPRIPPPPPPQPTNQTTTAAGSSTTGPNPSRALPSFSMTNPFLPLLQASTQFFSQTLQGLQSFQNSGSFPSTTTSAAETNEYVPQEQPAPSAPPPHHQEQQEQGAYHHHPHQHPPDQQNGFDRAAAHSSTSSGRSGLSMGELLFSAPPVVPPPQQQQSSATNTGTHYRGPSSNGNGISADSGYFQTTPPAPPTTTAYSGRSETQQEHPPVQLSSSNPFSPQSLSSSFDPPTESTDNCSSPPALLFGMNPSAESNAKNGVYSTKEIFTWADQLDESGGKEQEPAPVSNNKVQSTSQQSARSNFTPTSTSSAAEPAPAANSNSSSIVEPTEIIPIPSTATTTTTTSITSAMKEENSIFDQIRDFNELTMSKNLASERESVSRMSTTSNSSSTPPMTRKSSDPPLRPSQGLHFKTSPLASTVMRPQEELMRAGGALVTSSDPQSHAASSNHATTITDNRDPLKSISSLVSSALPPGSSSGASSHYPNFTSYRSSRSYSLRQASTDSIGSEASDLGSPDSSLPSLQRAMSCDSVCSDTSVVLGDLEQPQLLTGQLCIGLEYDSETADLLVNVIEAKEINGLHPDPTTPFDSYIRVYLLPDKTTNMQTRVYRKSLNPVYKEKFMFGLELAEFPIRSLVFYMYATDKFSNTLIGEAELKLGELDIHQLPLTTWLPLTDSGQRGGDLGEIMFSLSYLPTAERLTVVVVKARNLKFPRGNVGDPFVKVYLLQRGKKVSKKKSSMKKGERNPIFNEAMIFGVPAHALQTIQLRVTVADGSEAESNRACSIGHAIVGSTTTGKPLSHWNQMLSSLRKPIAMWHSLRK